VNTGFLNASCPVFLTQVFTIGQLAVFFTHGLAVQLQSMCVVHEPVQYGIGEGVIAEAALSPVAQPIATS